jgi:hypothetical protein
MLRRDADAVVHDPDPHAVGGLHAAHLDQRRAVRVPVLDRVADQVLQEPADQRRVAVDHRKRARAAYRGPVVLDRGAQVHHGVTEHLRDVGRTADRGCVPGPRVGQQRLDQPPASGPPKTHSVPSACPSGVTSVGRRVEQSVPVQRGQAQPLVVLAHAGPFGPAGIELRTRFRQGRLHET